MTILEQTSSNIDYLIPVLRMYYGDIDSKIYSDAVLRTALINAVRATQNKFNYKYQVYSDSLIITPQPVETPTGMIYISTAKGLAYISDVYTTNDIFRDPFTTFALPVPLIEVLDEMGIVYYAAYLTRRVQITSDSRQFYSWATEDIRFSNLGTEKLLSSLLQEDIDNINAFFGKNTINPKIVNFERV